MQPCASATLTPRDVCRSNFGRCHTDLTIRVSCSWPQEPQRQVHHTRSWRAGVSCNASLAERGRSRTQTCRLYEHPITQATLSLLSGQRTPRSHLPHKSLMCTTTTLTAATPLRRGSCSSLFPATHHALRCCLEFRQQVRSRPPFTAQLCGLCVHRQRPPHSFGKHPREFFHRTLSGLTMRRDPRLDSVNSRPQLMLNTCVLHGAAALALAVKRQRPNGTCALSPRSVVVVAAAACWGFVQRLRPRCYGRGSPRDRALVAARGIARVAGCCWR